MSDNKTKTTKSNTKKLTEKNSELPLSINQKKVIIHLEKNETVTELLEVLPDAFQMEDLHGNEKYLRLNRPITSNEAFVNQIRAGDVMLYGNATLVIFYKDFSTPYAYTRIGYIEDIEKLSIMEDVLKIRVCR